VKKINRTGGGESKGRSMKSARWNRKKGSGGPGVGDRPLIAFFGGDEIKVERGKVLQGGVNAFDISQVDGFDILFAFFTGVDAVTLLSLSAEILEGALFLISAVRAGQSLGPPLISAVRTEQVSFPFFF